MSATPHFPHANAAAQMRAALHAHPQLALLVLPQRALVQQLLDSALAPVPNCAPWFVGVARRGSQLIPFFDLAHWLGMEPLAAQERVLISIEYDNAVLGLCAASAPRIFDSHVQMPQWNGAETFRQACLQHTVPALGFEPAQWLRHIATQLTLAA